MVSVGQREQKWIWMVQTSVPRRMRTLPEKLHPFQGERSSVTDMSLSKSDTHDSGNAQAGFGNGTLKTGDKIGSGDRGFELKVTAESTKSQTGLQSY